MNKYLIVATLLLVFCCGAYSQRLNLDDSKNISIKSLTQYNKWRNQNKRNYLNDDQQLFRQLIFLENLKKIEEHNENPKNTFTIGTNQFSDLTDEEFASRILSYKPSEDQLNKLESEESVSFAGSTVTYAASIDWRTKGAVTAVKNQGGCGACWTFGATGVMEGYNFIQNKVLKTFSEQQLVDCAIPANGYSGKGCNGGNAEIALSYAQKFGAVESSTYPYVGVQGTCKILSPTTGYKPLKFSRLYSTPEAVKAALQISPVQIAVDASKWSSYRSGVFNGCSEYPSLNHAVLLVGYDTAGNWIVKNSWAASWGESGYIRLAAGNTCGVLNIPFAITG